MTWIKICGITRIEDAERVQNLGGDAIGCIFAASPRQVSAHQAREISVRLPGLIKVGVFVNAPVQIVAHLRQSCALDVIQLHGEEPPQYLEQLGGVIIKSLRPRTVADLERVHAYPMAWKILLDTYAAGQHGGTGLAITEDLLEPVADFSRIILAGGIGPDNAHARIKHYRPFGLDCSSGVEQAPGIKDVEKLTQLLEIIKNPSISHSDC